MNLIIFIYENIGNIAGLALIIIAGYFFIEWGHRAGFWKFSFTGIKKVNEVMQVPNQPVLPIKQINQ
jgi:hypothetical protein